MRYWGVGQGVSEELISCFADGIIGNSCPNPPSSPTNLIANPASVPSGSQSVLSANCLTGNVVWANGSSTVNPTITTTYYAKCVLGSCESSQVPVVVTVPSLPPSGNHCPYRDTQGWHYWSFGENRFKDGNSFGWDAANSRILFALNGSQGLYASLSPNPGGQPLTHQELRNAGVSEELISCFTNGQARTASASHEKNNIISVFPNPTDGKLTIEFYLENAEDIWLNIYSQQGKSMDIKNIEASEGNNVIELDIKNYPIGTYFINLQSSQKREVQKVLKVN